MAQITVRKLDDDVLDAIKARAKANKRSTEAEIRAILARSALERNLERRSLLSLAGSARSERTVDEIVADIRALRDEWEDRA
ncbi:plasmid stabilization protein [Aurantimonas sp. HBX-1]|uniref:FitA-like ribbon-helix-helix domain-containing protein n=1 Tax=Aurantimonas sp. HBX-1 TaxID=2906072 RepID=UPI001F3986E7|nr:plasmid stabilization protein [Aurantimonas sp. HBX-1]UIJ72162.1 plasmid stabilization protein [Aurantimonas sp. HBX-1]